MVYWIVLAVKIVLSGALAVLSYVFWQWAKSGLWKRE